MYNGKHKYTSTQVYNGLKIQVFKNVIQVLMF